MHLDILTLWWLSASDSTHSNCVDWSLNLSIQLTHFDAYDLLTLISDIGYDVATQFNGNVIV